MHYNICLWMYTKFNVLEFLRIVIELHVICIGPVVTKYHLLDFPDPSLFCLILCSWEAHFWPLPLGNTTDIHKKIIFSQ